MRILIIEDNARMGELLASGLADRGFVCDVAEDLGKAEASLAAAGFDLILLDIGLPDGNGLAWLRGKQKAKIPPVIVLTARDRVEDRISGLDSGADDYLQKPFSIDELAARIRAVMRRPGVRAGQLISIAGLSYDPAGHIAMAGEQRLELSRRELHLFELLIRRCGEVLDRNLIEESLYTFDEPVTPNAIEAVVSRLRRKLEDAGRAGRLHTIRGVGYLMSES